MKDERLWPRRPGMTGRSGMPLPGFAAKKPKHKRTPRTLRGHIVRGLERDHFLPVYLPGIKKTRRGAHGFVDPPAWPRHIPAIGFGRTATSIRGKGLSLARTGKIGHCTHGTNDRKQASGHTARGDARIKGNKHAGEGLRSRRMPLPVERTGKDAHCTASSKYHLKITGHVEGRGSAGEGLKSRRMPLAFQHPGKKVHCTAVSSEPFEKTGRFLDERHSGGGDSRDIIHSNKRPSALDSQFRDNTQ